VLQWREAKWGSGRTRASLRAYDEREIDEPVIPAPIAPRNQASRGHSRWTDEWGPATFS
jgi:hypothetical protein